MITFVESGIHHIDKEMNIFNSNTDYNLLAFDKKQLTNEDLFNQHTESEELKTTRFLVQNNESLIGIIEYGMSSPRANKPWLGLLIIDNQYQGQGYAKETYSTYEKQMKSYQVKSIQIAVHAVNKKALTFWKSLGFEKYDERVYEDKLFYSFEKQLT